MDTKTLGALTRVISEVKKKRKFRCLNIDCPCNDMIGGNDINIIEVFLFNEEVRLKI